MILLIDNYDSFTFNLYHYLTQLTDEQVIVKRNDSITIEEAAGCRGIVLSPGPGLPDQAGITKEIILKLGPTHPVLGICLGHQAIGEVYGAALVNLPEVQHGVQRNVKVIQKDEALFRGLPTEFLSGRYHSWVVSKENFPAELEFTATDDHSEIMAISHRQFPVKGIQFHPESVMTEHGLQIIENWIIFSNEFSLSRQP